jgi:hypothetical protein
MSASGTDSERDRQSRRVMISGLVIALGCFTLTGLLPAISWGGNVGVLLAHSILGHPVGGEALSGVLILSGMLLGASIGIAVALGCGVALGVVLRRLVRGKGG